MDPVPLQLLHAFVVFQESKNVQEAANRLGLSQPGLSKQLKQFERYMPGPVFTMRGRKKILTPFGQSLYVGVQDKIGRAQDVVQSVWKTHASPSLVEVRIAARRGVLDRISAELPFPGSLFFLEHSNESALEAIEQFRADIAITHSVPDSLHLIAKPLFREQFCLVIPKALHATRVDLSARFLLALKDLPGLGYRPKDELIAALYSYFSLAANVKMVRATENYQSLAEMVRAGLGWAILPSYFSFRSRDAWVIPLPAKALPAREFYLVYRAEMSALIWFRDLIAAIRAIFAGR